MTPEREPSASESAPTSLDWPRAAGLGDAFLAQVAVRLRRRRQRRQQIAGLALVAVLLAGGGTWLLSGRSESRPAAERSAVAVALPARQTLPDGSVVELDQGAEIAIAFTAARRRVVLRRGEAHFAVQRDPARPFVVAAGAVEVRAVGTAFSVGLRDDEIDVLVTHGRVAVEPPAGTASAPAPVSLAAPVFVDAGARLVVSDAPPPGARAAPALVSAEELRARLAWRAPRLDLNGTRLAEAVAAINRHSELRLVLADPSLGALEVSGFLRADNLDPLLHMLESHYGIAAERAGPQVTLRRAR